MQAIEMILILGLVDPWVLILEVSYMVMDKELISESVDFEEQWQRQRMIRLIKKQSENFLTVRKFGGSCPPIVTAVMDVT